MTATYTKWIIEKLPSITTGMKFNAPAGIFSLCNLDAGTSFDGSYLKNTHSTYWEFLF